MPVLVSMDGCVAQYSAADTGARQAGARQSVSALPHA